MRSLVNHWSPLTHTSHCMTTSRPSAATQMTARVSPAMKPDALPSATLRISRLWDSLRICLLAYPEARQCCWDIFLLTVPGGSCSGAWGEVCCTWHCLLMVVITMLGNAGWMCHCADLSQQPLDGDDPLQLGTCHWNQHGYDTVTWRLPHCSVWSLSTEVRNC